MEHKKIIHSALMLVSLALSGVALATPSGEMLGNTCAACHGTKGNTNGPATPGLAGISPEYFTDAMKAYQTGARPATVMGRIAKGYTEEEIKAMASYFAGQKYRPLAQKPDKALAATGKKLHTTSCEKCHERGGRSNEEATILAGQPIPYLQWTMDDFTSGKREMPKKMKAKMEEVHKAKGDEAYKALVNFYGSQGK